MDDKRYTTRQAANAANITRLRLDQWVSREYFTPTHAPEPGAAREYTLKEIIELATLAELTRMGIDPRLAKNWVRPLHRFDDDDAIFIVWQGPGELIPCSEPANPSQKPSGGAAFYDPDCPSYVAEIKRLREVQDVLSDPGKRSLVAVNLNHVKKRVLDTLGD